MAIGDYKRLSLGSKKFSRLVQTDTCLYCATITDGKKKFCSSRCASRHARGTPQTRSCRGCGLVFAPLNGALYCSAACKGAHEREAQRNKRYATVSPAVRLLRCASCGCGISHARRAGRPQTYCADCKLEIETRPTPPRDLECVVCKCAFHAKDKRTKYCSRSCGRIARKAANPDAVRAEYLRGKQLEKDRKALDPVRLMKAARGDLVSALKRLIVSKDAAEKAARCCAVCGVSLAQGRKKYCSQSCYNKSEVTRAVRRRSRSSYRAAKKANTIEAFDPIEILERDKWRCQICGVKTPKSLRGTSDPRAPELDHIIPISQNGAHARFNAQCACKRCNRAKSDKPLGQMLLIG